MFGKKVMKKKTFTILSLFIATVFWLIESVIHYYIFGESEFEFIPQDFNELWMRVVIVLLIFFFGVFSDFYSRKLILEEKQSEAMEIYNSMLNAAHHILNNMLNQMQLVRIEALKSKDFDQDIIKLYDDGFEEALELIKKLSSIEEITTKNIDVSVYPRYKDELPCKGNPENSTTN